MEIEKGIRVAKFSTIISFILIFLKGLIGMLTGATILIADAVHSISDTLAIGSSWLGLTLAKRKPTDRFPYGLYKAETLMTFLISLFILYAGVELIREGINKIKDFHPIRFPIAGFIITFIAGIVSFFLSRWQKKTGKEINSSSLVINGEERFADVLISAVVFLGILFSALRINFVEGIGTIGMSFFILYLGFKFGKISVLNLLDANIAPDMEKKIIQIIRENSKIKNIEKVKLRQAGPFYLGEIHIQIEKSADVERGHQIAHDAVFRIKKEFPYIESITVHIEPFKTPKWKVMIPVKENNLNLDNAISHHFGRSPYFLIIDMEDKEIKKMKILENPFKEKKIRIALSIARELSEKEKINVVIVKEIGEIAFHALRDNFIEIYKTEEETVSDAIKKLIDNKLPLLVKPTHSSEEKIKGV